MNPVDRALRAHRDRPRDPPTGADAADEREFARPRRRGPPLTARMEAIAACVLQGSTLADVGTDHGWLPIALLARGDVPSAIAIDVREAPLAVAARNAARYLDETTRPALALELGDGLEPLVDAVGTIVIAGLGGARIVELLEQASGRSRWPLARRFVLAPNDATSRVRAALLRTVEGRAPSLGLTLVDEVMVLDHGRYFPVLVAEAFDGQDANSADPSTAHVDPEAHALTSYAGPYLRARRDPVWLDWLRWRRAHLRRAADRASGDRSERATSRPLSAAAARELAWVETLLGHPPDVGSEQVLCVDRDHAAGCVDGDDLGG